MGWRSNHPYLTPMTLADMKTLAAANDPMMATTLACPDCGEGSMRLDLEPAPSPPTNRLPAQGTAVELLPALVCTRCGYAVSANHAIYGPRDTTSRRG